MASAACGPARSLASQNLTGAAKEMDDLAAHVLSNDYVNYIHNDYVNYIHIASRFEQSGRTINSIASEPLRAKDRSGAPPGSSMSR